MYNFAFLGIFTFCFSVIVLYILFFTYQENTRSRVLFSEALGTIHLIPSNLLRNVSIFEFNENTDYEQIDRKFAD